ncbi:GTP 3',8-cyclase MoaA [cf. Phormidesmis sp. LEGE 11477]|uniref:GTP 3',8-cyclase MoaA n=1 Tax=cf. Phormidesmis sp. LEGE 11477 TaxID=1828680 RepID=UPI00187E2AF5|nr:GTP 3',8-cyclase MoaA [cf. Phormidesmis sp. LEGE 11477]MBE9062998.1 GTP 3',8-cyclase MoaA [cf. Phormidesmis sp. LEGE 11477]
MSKNRIDYLRISLIDRCNFKCVYCMPEGKTISYALQENWLSVDELINLVESVFIPLGFRKFRLTGGEPLLRPDVITLIRAIAALSGTEDLSLTTNAYRLADMADSLYQAGLRRINISLDSLQPETFERITGGQGRTRWQKVWTGIQAAHRVGFSPLKLNVVVISGVNDSEILELAALTLNQAWHVRFIEFMPIGNQDLFQSKGWIDSACLQQQIRSRWGLITASIQGYGPADVFKIPEAKGTIGFISQMSDCFCDRCNRMRLSADGWLRPCLLNETGQINLRQALRQKQSVQDIRDQVAALLVAKDTIHFKARDSGTTAASTALYSRTMSQIGG